MDVVKLTCYIDNEVFKQNCIIDTGSAQILNNFVPNINFYHLDVPANFSVVCEDNVRYVVSPSE